MSNKSFAEGQGVQLTGQLDLVLTDEFGRVKERRHVPNLVVTAGLAVIADRMKATPAKAAMTHMAVGTTNTTPALGNTTLAAEVSGSRTTLTSTAVTVGAITYICTFGAGVGTGALVEAGLFNASSAGDMLCRTVYTVINKGASDSLTITWTVTVS